MSAPAKKCPSLPRSLFLIDLILCGVRFLFEVADNFYCLDYVRGGLATQVKQPKVLNFKPLEEAILSMEPVMTDFAKFDAPQKLHLCYMVGWEPSRSSSVLFTTSFSFLIFIFSFLFILFFTEPEGSGTPKFVVN